MMTAFFKKTSSFSLTSASCGSISRWSMGSLIDRGGHRMVGKSAERETSSFNDLVLYPFGSQFLIQLFGAGPCIKRTGVELRRAISAFDHIGAIPEL